MLPRAQTFLLLLLASCAAFGGVKAERGVPGEWQSLRARLGAREGGDTARDEARARMPQPRAPTFFLILPCGPAPPAINNPAPADPSPLESAKFLAGWPLKVENFVGPEVTVNCSAIAGGTPGLGAFGNCTSPDLQAGGCGCTPGFATCPAGSSVVSCSSAQYPAGPGPGADWSIGTSLVKPEKNQCITIWINTARVPRASTMRVSPVCSRLVKDKF